MVVFFEKKKKIKKIVGEAAFPSSDLVRESSMLRKAVLHLCATPKELLSSCSQLLDLCN